MSVRVEVRSINHRFLELNVRLPRQYLVLEEKVRQMVGQYVFRGHLDIFVALEQERAKKHQIKVDKELAMAYYDYLREIAQYLDIPADIGLRDLICLPGVLELAEEWSDAEAAWPVIAEALRQALEELIAARTREGERLAADLRMRVHRMEGYVREIEGLVESALEAYRERLLARLKEWLNGYSVDKQRVEAEIAFMAERSDVTEEIVRIRSHLEGILSSLSEQGPIGRRLDFLVQELHRELTTLGNKAVGTAIAPLVVVCKEEGERIREQVQNLE